MAEKLPSSFDLDEHEKEIESAYKEGGSKHVVDTMMSSLGKWQETPLNIGVTGRSGVGKSTFINTIRGLTAECPNAAPTGATETTRQVKSYPHPDNKKLVFWDLPGIGTTDFPRETYFKDERVQFDRYDMFLILTQGRFFENDVLLAETAKEKKKAFCLVRTKVDNDVDNERKAKKLQFKNDPNFTKKLLEKIRSEVAEGLSNIQNGNKSTEEFVFLIDCHDMTWTKYDFGKLIEMLIDGCKGLKRQAFILSLNILQPNVLEQKVTLLRDEIWKISAASALGAVVPVPGCSFAVDVALISEAALFYIKQLGITENKIALAAEMAGLDVNALAAKLGLQTVDTPWTAAGVSLYLAKYAGTKAGQYVVKLFIPGIGSLFAAGFSYKFTTASLNEILNAMESDAKKLHTFMLSHESSI